MRFDVNAAPSQQLAETTMDNSETSTDTAETPSNNVNVGTHLELVDEDDDDLQSASVDRHSTVTPEQPPPPSRYPARN